MAPPSGMVAVDHVQGLGFRVVVVVVFNEETLHSFWFSCFCAGLLSFRHLLADPV